MIRLIAEGWVAVQACWRVLTFQTDWEGQFNTTLAGFWRSFAALLPAIPMVLLIHAAMLKFGAPVSLTDHLVLQILSWTVFPIAAAAACFAAGARQAFVRWVVVHNWGVLWLYFYLFVVWMAYTAGILPRIMLGMALTLYPYIRVLVHWRLAYVSLGLPTITSALTASAPLLAIHLVTLLYRASGETADQASSG